MEQWEKEYREQLELEIPNGAYEIGNGTDFIAVTGKDGYINYLVELRKAIMRFGSGIEEQISNPNNSFLPATEQDFIDMMNNLENRKNIKPE